MSSAEVHFGELLANESDEARRIVHEFARTLYAEQAKTWEANKASDRKNKVRPPTWDECLAKSIETRKRREAKSTDSTRLINRYNNL